MTTLDDIKALEARVGEAIIGQRDVVRRIVLGLLADGHVLLEGLPGLAKTRAVKALARAMPWQRSDEVAEISRAKRCDGGRRLFGVDPADRQ